MKKQSQIAAVILAAALLSSLPVLAQSSRIYRDGNSWVEEITGTMSATRMLKVETDIGSVQVQGGAANEIRYTVRKRSNASGEEAARRIFSQFDVSATRHGETTVFEGDSHGASGGRRLSAEFVLTVPRTFDSTTLSTDGGAITVNNLASKISAESGGGAIQFDNTNGTVSAETGGGTITVGMVQGPLTLHTGGGSIHVGSTNGRVQASSGGGSIYIGSAAGVDIETGGGSINVVDCKGESARLQTGGGSIEMGEAGGPVSLETGGGSIHLTGAKGFVKAETGGGSIELLKLSQGAHAETGAGTITAEFVDSNGAQPSYLETNAGDVIVYVSPSVKMTVDASVENAWGHKIRSDFAELKISSEGGNYGPKTYFAEGNLNGGGPVLKVRSTLGNIEFRKR